MSNAPSAAPSGAGALLDALLADAYRSDDPITLALAGTMASGCAHGLPPARWLRGMNGNDRAAMMALLFVDGGHRALHLPAETVPADAADTADAQAPEFEDLLQLLLEAAKPPEPRTRWLACAIASASLYDNHLWQDLQLPNRAVLSQLMAQYFPDIARRNTGNMRWKAFFYKQLCERAGNVCRAPSCGACDDYDECFGPE
jgi:nitrogen fixation protein NifQ